MIEDEEKRVSVSQGTPDAARAAAEVSPDHQGTPASSSAPGAMNGSDLQLYIGRGLRAVFDDVAKQPVPDRLLDLMKKLG